jgi:tRNA threonylcarbamoyladenosine biosynthesis protein TsaE
MAAPQRHSAVLEIPLPDESATAALARHLAALARRGDVIALFGELGSGKTSFARAFVNALARPGGGAAEEVPSPTFTLVQIYDRSPAPVWHFDLYRLSRAEEVHELGFEEALAEGISLIEWPERLGDLLPPHRLAIRFAFADEAGARRATLEGGGTWPERLRALRDAEPLIGAAHG